MQVKLTWQLWQRKVPPHSRELHTWSVTSYSFVLFIKTRFFDFIKFFDDLIPGIVLFEITFSIYMEYMELITHTEELLNRLWVFAASYENCNVEET